MQAQLPPLDAAAQFLVAQMALSKPLHECSVAEARATAAAATPLFGEAPHVQSVADVAFPTGDGALARGRLYTPSAAPAGYLVYFHGGGWVVGEPQEFDVLARHMALESGWVVLLVDYRLAPEHPYPAAVLDADAAVAWAGAEAGRAGLPLAVAGDSAGGNLAAVAALKARDRGQALAAQLLVYPVVDHDLTKPGSYSDPATDTVLTTRGMAWFWRRYAPDEAARAHPDVSPLRAPSLHGVAPALVMTAGYDPLRDDGEAYAARLVQAGVPLIFRRFADQPHGFFTFVNVLPAAQSGRAFLVAALHALAAPLAIPSNSVDPTRANAE